MQSDLEQLKELSTPALKCIAGEQFPVQREALYDQLLQARLLRTLTNVEDERLAALRHEADLLMLRKARALALLNERGVDIEILLDSALSG